MSHQYDLPPSALSTGARRSIATSNEKIRLSVIMSQHAQNMQMSKREAERLIMDADVTYAGEIITDRHFRLTLKEAHSTIKVKKKLLMPRIVAKSSQAKVWIAHKLKGEVVTDDDPHGRPSLLKRLHRGGVGQRINDTEHLKAVGRLDMSTEGLILITNSGEYKRQLELPSNKLHRTYRARVHGKMEPHKLKALRTGAEIEGIRYKGMKVELEHINSRRQRRGPSTNTWLRLTCVEGKNRIVRKVLEALGLTVNRLIRTSYGDYNLKDLPPGSIRPVKMKPLKSHKARGALKTITEAPVKGIKTKEDVQAAPVAWVSAKSSSW